MAHKIWSIFGKMIGRIFDTILNYLYACTSDPEYTVSLPILTELYNLPYHIVYRSKVTNPKCHI